MDQLKDLEGYDYYVPDRTELSAMKSLNYYTETPKADCYSSDPPMDLKVRFEQLIGIDVEILRRRLASDYYTGVERDVVIAYVTAADLNTTTTSPFLDCNNFDELLTTAHEFSCNANRKATPGFPYNLRFNSVGQALDSVVKYDGYIDHERIVGFACFTVIHYVLESSSRISSPSDALRRKLGSYNQLIVKLEPHPSRKLFPRIVVAMPVHFQIADQMMMILTPPKPGTSSLLYGWGNHYGEALSEAMANVTGVTGGSWLKSDVSGWERSVSERSLLWANSILACIGDYASIMMPIMNNRALALSNAAYLLRNGVVIAKNKSCLQVSGQFHTTTSNGIMRSAFAVSQGGRAFCNGDDCLEINFKSAEQMVLGYQSMKLSTRDVEVCDPNDFEFSSHRFQRRDGVLHFSHVAPQKSVYRMIGTKSNLIQVLHLLSPNFSDKVSAGSFISDLQCVADYLTSLGYDYSMPAEEFVDSLWSTDNTTSDESTEPVQLR